MKKFNRKRIKQLLTKEFLMKAYSKNKKSATQIAKELNCDSVTVLNYLKKFNISVRNKKECHKGSYNGRFIDGRCSNQYYCIDCNKKISYPTWRYGQGRCNWCSNKGERNTMFGRRGKLSPLYIEDLVRKYPIEFNKELKEQIRERDNHECQLCGCLEIENGRKLCVHHIDYNKENLIPYNLISLCRGCNVKVNTDREYWKEYFNKIIFNLV